MGTAAFTHKRGEELVFPLSAFVPRVCVCALIKDTRFFKHIRAIFSNCLPASSVSSLTEDGAVLTLVPLLYHSEQAQWSRKRQRSRELWSLGREEESRGEKATVGVLSTRRQRRTQRTDHVVWCSVGPLHPTCFSVSGNQRQHVCTMHTFQRNNKLSNAWVSLSWTLLCYIIMVLPRPCDSSVSAVQPHAEPVENQHCIKHSICNYPHPEVQQQNAVNKTTVSIFTEHRERLG